MNRIRGWAWKGQVHGHTITITNSLNTEGIEGREGKISQGREHREGKGRGGKKGSLTPRDKGGERV